MSFKKWDNVRLVTFKEDYRAKKGGKVIYLKGETHAMHQSTAEKIKNNDGKIEVKEYNRGKEIEKAKAKVEKKD